MDNILQAKEIETSNNTNWFKKLFLGIMGSVALHKATSSYYENVLKFDKESVSEFWKRFIDLFNLNIERVGFHVVTGIVLLYFLANIIRYYMAIYINEHFTDEIWKIGKAIHKKYNILNNPQLKEKVEAEINKNKSIKDFRLEKIGYTIGDILLSLIIFFLIGVAGLSITNINGFAFCMILVLISDLSQIIYQRLIYFPKKIQMEKVYRKTIRDVIMADKNLKDATNSDEWAKFFEDIDNDNSGLHSQTLKNWVWVDLREMLAWICIILIDHLFIKNDIYLYWYLLIPILFLIWSFCTDIKKNQEAWADMFDIEVK